MKVSVDLDLCHSNANCIDECPEVFRLDDSDKPLVRLREPEESLRGKVEFAAQCCPRQAIKVTD